MNISQLSNVIIALSLTLIVIILLAFMLKKLKKYTPILSSAINVIAGVSLGTKAKVVLLEVDNVRLLVSVTDTKVQTLHVFKQENATQQTMVSK